MIAETRTSITTITNRHISDGLSIEETLKSLGKWFSTDDPEVADLVRGLFTSSQPAPTRSLDDIINRIADRQAAAKAAVAEEASEPAAEPEAPHTTPKEVMESTIVEQPVVPEPPAPAEPPVNGHRPKDAAAAGADPFPELPALLKNTPNWVRWRLEDGDDGKPTKVPYQTNGYKASSTNPATWTDYQTATSGAKIDQTQGVGFVVNGGIVGTDIDGCIDPATGEITEWAKSIVDALDCYTEITPSQLGLRVWSRGTLPGTDKMFKLDPAVGFGDKVQIEIFTDSKYFTVTGDAYFDTPGDVEERDHTEVYQLLHDIRSKHPAPKKDKASGEKQASGPVHVVTEPGSFVVDKLTLLMTGTIESTHPFVIKVPGNTLYYSSPSEADLALATCLAIKHGDNPSAIAEEFRKSPLYSPGRKTKWDRLEASTIKKAIKSAQEMKDKSNQSSQTAEPSGAAQSPPDTVVDDPADNDARFDMHGETFDSKVYEDMAQRSTPYPDPGEGDLISLLSHKLVTGTSIPLAYVREPLKGIVLHALDGKLAHPAYQKMSLRGNYFSLGESEGGKTTGLEWALGAANTILQTALIHKDSLMRYKSETTFIRSFTPEGTIKRDAHGVQKSGHSGHSSQFLHIKEGGLLSTCSDYFSAVFSQLTNLYDQTEAGTESMTNGDFTAPVVKVSSVMCFTPTDFKSTFGGKGTIGGGGLNRWGATNPPRNHDYDDRDWERLDDSVFQAIGGELAVRVFTLATGERVVLKEEPGAVRIRLEVKAMLRKAGKVGNRLLDYFMREQVAQAATAADGRLVMTEAQAVYAKQWVESQLQVRKECWPSDSNNQIEAMEHAIRKACATHFVSETKLKDACHYYREGSGGWFVFSAAMKNARDSEAIKLTAKTRKGTRAYCPGSCDAHPVMKA